MTRYGSDDVAFLIANGQNILGDTTQLADSREALTEETTVLGSTWQEHSAVGVKRYTLSQQGFFNDAANRSNAALITPGSSKILCLGLEGNTIGKRMIGAQLVQANYERLISRGALHKANARYEAEGQQDEGRILHALGAETANDDTEATPYDGGAQSSNGGVAYLQVTALSLGGYTSVTVTVIDDADGAGSFGVLQAFTNVTAIGAQRIVIAGTVERYLAVSWAFNGSGSNPSIEFMVGFTRNP